ncbi:CHAP domain-containing protein [Oenococcus sicerae]|uniref:LysM peptidoglycan-binding domain-containing protein n=1 Tax=Oenococcus sicerae TaxID=2203724 RepID=A0AAJ1RAF6_9LACO|nr:CHAP domain-containing protein [Oenococcus sicerae]MDN6900736.1 LysM peptidoglycan-binding domain-containing protein [Oenococcus sicerae]
MTTKTVKNVLLVSAGAAATLAVGAASANADTVNVKQGDSVWALAKQYNTTTDAIIKANKLTDPALILSGASLNIPGSAAASDSASTAAASTAATSISAKNADGTVTIASGDTLYGIADRYDVAVSTLIANNNGSTFIVTGQKLSLTAAATTTTNTTSSAAQTTTTSAAASSSAAPVASSAASQAPVASSAAAQTSTSTASSQTPVRKAVTASYATRKVATTTTTTASTSGNSYYYGQCTWYVKNMLGWVPNGLGNASQWASAAAADGFTVNNTPTVGSVVVFQAGQAWAGGYGHVAVVTGVNGDGSIRITEGNFAGRSSNTRTVTSAASYQYIHQ